MKCDLNKAEIEGVYLLFARINELQGRIDAGIGAHEDYAATINELNALVAGDCRRGEALCRQALIQLETIQAARTAKLEIEKYRQQLQMRLRKTPGTQFGQDYASK